MENSFPRANKRLGQHFLKDPNIIQTICEDFRKEAQVILEIGPGPGSLTAVLARKNLPLFVVEKDPRFLSQLESFLDPDHMVREDALKISWEDFLRERQLLSLKIWLVSNLPYNVGVPLFIRFLQCAHFPFLTLMFQEEVARKILGEVGKHDNDMNSLRALAQTYFETNLLCRVGPRAFVPPPKVKSMVISFRRRDKPEIPLEEFKSFEKFLRALFQFKRKFLVKGLRPLYSQEKIDKALHLCHISPKARAEVLELSQIHGLYKDLSQ